MACSRARCSACSFWKWTTTSKTESTSASTTSTGPGGASVYPFRRNTGPSQGCWTARSRRAAPQPDMASRALAIRLKNTRSIREHINGNSIPSDTLSRILVLVPFVLTVPTRLGSATVNTGAVRDDSALVCRLLSVHGHVPEPITITGFSEKVLGFRGIIF